MISFTRFPWRPSDRVRCACDAAEAAIAGKPAYGFPKIKEILKDDIPNALAKWLGIGGPSPGANTATGAGATAGPGARPLIQLGADLTVAAASRGR